MVSVERWHYIELLEETGRSPLVTHHTTTCMIWERGRGREKREIQK